MYIFANVIKGNTYGRNYKKQTKDQNTFYMIEGRYNICMDGLYVVRTRGAESQSDNGESMMCSCHILIGRHLHPWILLKNILDLIVGSNLKLKKL